MLNPTILYIQLCLSNVTVDCVLLIVIDRTLCPQQVTQLVVRDWCLEFIVLLALFLSCRTVYCVTGLTVICAYTSAGCDTYRSVWMWNQMMVCFCLWKLLFVCFVTSSNASYLSACMSTDWCSVCSSLSVKLDPTFFRCDVAPTLMVIATEHPSSGCHILPRSAQTKEACSEITENFIKSWNILKWRSRT